MKIRYLTLVLLALLALGTTALAQDEAEPGWMPPLKKQLMKDENCMLLYATGMHEFQLAGRTVLSGRAHCEDGRSFDVERKGIDRPFTISVCQPVAC